MDITQTLVNAQSPGTCVWRDGWRVRWLVVGKGLLAPWVDGWSCAGERDDAVVAVVGDVCTTHTPTT